jgi:hypothetical protein
MTAIAEPPAAAVSSPAVKALAHPIRRAVLNCVARGMAETAIEWATHVVERLPSPAATASAPGCAHCYALSPGYAGRLKAMGQPKYQRDGGKASGPGSASPATRARWRSRALAEAATRVRQLDERPLPR